MLYPDVSAPWVQCMTAKTIQQDTSEYIFALCESMIWAESQTPTSTGSSLFPVIDEGN